MGKAHGNCCLQCYLLGLPWRSWQDWRGAGAGRSWNSRCSQATRKVVGTSMWEMGANSSTQSLLQHLLALCPQPALPGPPTKLNCPLVPNGPLGHVSGKSSRRPEPQEGRASQFREASRGSGAVSQPTVTLRSCPNPSRWAMPEVSPGTFCTESLWQGNQQAAFLPLGRFWTLLLRCLKTPPACRTR